MIAVIDASAFMALMLDETGADIVRPVIRGSLMSAVNASECCARGVERGVDAGEVLGLIRMCEMTIVDFDLASAVAAARLREPTRILGAGIGDRACLALGLRRSLPVFTADRRLGDIDPALGIDVRLIR